MIREPLTIIPDVVAVVPAAGAGTRLGGPVAKPYRDLGGRPILARTLETLAAAPSIEGIVVAADADSIARVYDLMPETVEWWMAIRGGAERFDSVRLCLEEVPEFTRIVVVHDGARPLVTVREIEETIALAREIGAAITVSAPVETVKRIDGDVVTATLDRDRIRLAQTPQAFRAGILREAYRRAVEEGIKTTDEAAIVERTGAPIGYVEADRWNRKITVEEDLRLAEWVLEERRR